MCRFDSCAAHDAAQCGGPGEGEDMTITGTFLSRNNVEHLLVSGGSGCATCGKPHQNADHARTVALHLNGTPCHLVERQAYPYPCIAADRHPDHVVVACTSHNTWWHVERA